MMKSAIIVSTYNWPGALRLCLKSIQNQHTLPDEIIIADDGSGEETRQVVNGFTNFFKGKVKHIWQEDKGFRLSRIRNLAIKQAESSYLIFIDGDVILHPCFVRDHIEACALNTFLTGSRVLLSENESNKRLQSGQILFPFIPVNSKNQLNGISCKLLAKLFLKNNNGIFNVRGCNMSFWKNDLIAVNGFDVQYEGWGREDSDIVLRMLNAGFRKRKLKFSAIQYHIFHDGQRKSSLHKNDLLLREAQEQKKIKAKTGLAEL